MNHCRRCDGLVPQGVTECPNCRSTKKAWWAAPLAFAGAGLATLTLSACYGAPCAAVSYTHLNLRVEAEEQGLEQ